VDDRCPTSSGPYRCDKPHGHGAGDECVTRERPGVWVGPAMMPRHVTSALADRDARHVHQRHDLERALRRAEARARNAEARASMTHLIVRPDTDQTEEAPRD
jgi:hypothetical protein